MLSKIRAVTSFVTLVVLVLPWFGSDALASDKAPDWMQSLKLLPVPVHGEKDDSVCMYSETILTVKPNGKMTRLVREAYRILRPDSPKAAVRIYFDDQTKITDLHAWSMPAVGKDYAVKDRDALIVGSNGGSELISDDKMKFLQIPGADPGALVGYEYEQEERPYFQEDQWFPQDRENAVAVREARYILQLPAGWLFKSTWQNREPIEPVNTGDNRWQWVVKDIKAVKHEDEMPAFSSILQHLTVKLAPAAGQGKVADTWLDLGNWYVGLVKDRREPTPLIKQTVATLIANQPTMLEKMQAIARFSQSEIRYVAIELGIGGHQPHFAKDIFTNRYGDCKDKSTLLGTMLNEIGVNSYYILVNTDHSAVLGTSAPALHFNHAIIAIQLPESMKDASLIATLKHPVLGNILVFDPTNEYIPFGQLPGYLQGNHALLVRAEGSELITLPIQNSVTNGVTRTAKLSLNEKGVLSGEVLSRSVGYLSFEGRARLQSMSMESQRTKYLESGLADSLSSFKIVNFKINNLAEIVKPLEYQYSFEAEKYAKFTGDMLMIRPRVIGSKSSSLLETEDKRQNPVQFVSLQKDADDFSVTLPPGYAVDDLPTPTDLDYPFGSYHSKTVVTGNTLHYTRTFEIKDFIVAVDKLDDLKKFYRQIYHDERAIAVFHKN